MAEGPGSLLVTEHADYLEGRCQAPESVEDVKRMLLELLNLCKERKPARLLVDLTEVPELLSLMDRYDIGLIGGQFSPYVRRAAALTTPENRDPQKFGARVAQNRGLTVDVFTDRQAALSWLLNP